jgi:large subunit ribosomal protein L40e
MEATQLTIVIKMVSGENREVEICSTSKISELKSVIKMVSSIAENRQRLIYRGRVLEDHLTVEHYRIESKHVVHLVVRPENAPPPEPSAPQQQAQTVGGSNNTAGSNSFARIGMAPLSSDLLSTLLGAALQQPVASSNSSSNPLPSMEHLRQGILSFHTLVSTMDAHDISFSRASSVDDQDIETSLPPFTGQSHDRKDGHAINKESRDDFSVARRVFFVGQWIDVKDTVSQWLEATIMAMDNAGRRVFVHYNGW